jgi:hypothetical protein
MADGHFSTTNSSGAELPEERPKGIGPRPQRTMTACDLEVFLTPVVHASRLISLLDPDEIQGVGADEALRWLGAYTHDRVTELAAFIYGRQPAYHAGFDAEQRAEALKGLPSHSEWIAAGG